jgi:trehalose-phosphatase
MKTRQANKLSLALEKKNEIIEQLQKGRPVIFLDYDGTLTPIVDEPSQAILPNKTKQLIRKLSERWTVIIMTGRALNDARNLVDLENLVYAGSHGFNIAGPEESFQEESNNRFLPSLDEAERELQGLDRVDGVLIERKPFAITIHYRQASKGILPDIEKQINEVAGHFPDLVKTTGKKIFELRPKAD